MDDAEIVAEVSTQEGYARWASCYDQEVNALIVLEEAHTDRLLAGISSTRVLDVGTGTGRYALKLARSGARVTAIDQSPEMLARARQAAESQGLAIDFQQVSLEDGLPFAAQHFDLLTCALMLCHMPDLLPVLRECARVLQPGGTLLLTDFHPGSVRYGWRTAFRQAGVRYVLPNMAHTRETYLHALAACGLRLLSALDLPLGALPARAYPPPLSPAFIQAHAQVPFCLILLARKS
jgi:ubiquinone/menaquinone biosynthesis C-methylase UbiE